MRRILAIAAIVLAAMCVSSVVFAGNGETLRPRWPGARPQVVPRRGGPQRPGGGPARPPVVPRRGGPQSPGGPAQRAPLPEFLEFGREKVQRLLDTEEAKTLREELKKLVEALQAEQKELHEKIRQEIQAGKNPQEVLPQYQDQLKALLRKGLLLRLEYREKFHNLIKKNIDKCVDALHEELRERFRERHGQREGGEPPAPPRPHAGDEGDEGDVNPFQD